MKVHNPILLSMCILTAAVASVKVLSDEARLKKQQQSILKSYNFPQDEYVKILDRVDKKTVEFKHIQDSLSFDKKLKQAYEYGRKSVTNSNITIEKVIKKLK